MRRNCTMLSKKGTAKRLMNAQQELILAKWQNTIEGKVLDAISDGLNLCNVDKVPEWVANNMRIMHPDWEVYYTRDYTQFCW